MPYVERDVRRYMAVGQVPTMLCLDQILASGTSRVHQPQHPAVHRSGGLSQITSIVDPGWWLCPAASLSAPSILRALQEAESLNESEGGPTAGHDGYSRIEQQDAG